MTTGGKTMPSQHYKEHIWNWPKRMQPQLTGSRSASSFFVLWPVQTQMKAIWVREFAAAAADHFQWSSLPRRKANDEEATAKNITAPGTILHPAPAFLPSPSTTGDRRNYSSSSWHKSNGYSAGGRKLGFHLKKRQITVAPFGAPLGKLQLIMSSDHVAKDQCKNSAESDL